MTAKARRTIMTAPAMGSAAGITPDSPSAQVAEPVAGSTPLPAVIPPTPAPVSDIASKQASNNGHSHDSEMTFSTGDLVRGLPEADQDLVPINVRVPRMVAEAIDIQHRLTRRPRQAIVADALLAALSARLLDDVHQRLYGKPRP